MRASCSSRERAGRRCNRKKVVRKSVLKGWRKGRGADRQLAARPLLRQRRAPRGFHLQSRAFSSAMRRSTSSSTSAARTSSARHRRSSMRTLGLLLPSSISER